MAIAISWTGTLGGHVRIADCFHMATLNQETGMYEDVVGAGSLGLKEMQQMHLVDNLEETSKYKKVFGWRLENPVVYDPPRSYRHIKGCVTWVPLSALGPAIKKATVQKKPPKKQPKHRKNTSSSGSW